MISFAGAVKRTTRLAAALIKSAYVMSRFVVVVYSDIRITAVGTAYEALAEQVVVVIVSLSVKRFTLWHAVVSSLPELG